MENVTEPVLDTAKGDEVKTYCLAGSFGGTACRVLMLRRVTELARLTGETKTARYGWGTGAP